MCKKAFKALAFILCSFCIVVPAHCQEEQESAWSVDTSVDLFSDYMFRGLLLYEGASIQPSLTISYDTGFGSLTVSEWMHFSAETGRTEGRFTELDSTLEYSHAVGPFTLAIGHVFYSFSDYGDGSDIADTSEIYTTVAADVFLSPTFSFYHDYREFHAQYYELALSHEFTLPGAKTEDITLTPSIAFGFGSNTENLYADNGGFDQITTGVALSIPLGTLSISPGLYYTFGIDDLVDNRFWFGTNLTASF
jgi:hypothetical protein